MRYSFLLLICVLTYSLSSLGQTQRVPQYLGNEAPALAPTARIISLAPVITETIFALEAGKQLVGVTRFCDRPAAAQKLPKVGGFIDGNLEKIISLNPSVVIAMPQSAQKNILSQIQKQGIPVFLVFGDRISEVKELVTALGQLFGKQEKAHELIRKFNHDYANLKHIISSHGNEISIVALASTQPIIVAGRDTFIQESLQHMGLIPQPTANKILWPTWSLEFLVQQKPHWILLLYPTSDVGSLENKIGPLCQNKCRFLKPKKPLFQRPGLFLIEDMKRLAQLITTQEPRDVRP
jgi:iron complex transport system substrate-binding protein